MNQLTNEQLATQIATLYEEVKSRPTKEEIEEIVTQSMASYFEKKGTTLKAILIGTAVVVGSLTVILGGIKAILAYLGFTYIGK